jgi:hypothetical protein
MERPHWFRLAAIVSMVFALASCAPMPPAPTTPAAPASANAAPLSMLWVGNSFFYYNNSMHGHVGQLLRASTEGGRGWRQVSATISGSGLNWHDMEAYFKPGGMGSYSFNAKNEVVFNSGDRALPKLFDAVLMMDCSQCRSIRSWRRCSNKASRATRRSRAATAPSRSCSCRGPIKTRPR